MSTAPLARLAFLALAGCASTSSTFRLSTPTPIAVAFIQDFDDSRPSVAAPAALREGVSARLRERNLIVQEIPFASAQASLRGERNTEARLRLLKAQSAQSPWLLLIEAKARFYSQLSGRYRWTVQCKLTLLDLLAQEKPSIAAELEAPALLDFDHEREVAAIAAVANVIAYRAGSLLDGVLPKPPSKQAFAPASTAGRPDSIYFVLIDRFANGDPANDEDADPKDPSAFHGGDIAGVTAHLDHLQRLGIKTIWLSPSFRTRTERFFGHGAFHGYWVWDLAAMEPRFGTLAELQKLSAELHRRGMRLYLDLVLNHVGFDAPLLSSHPHWFHGKGAISDFGDAEKSLDHDVHGLPDLAQENAEVFDYLVAVSEYWVRKVAPDGFRLDAVKHVPTAFWKRFSRAIKAAAGPNFELLGEVFEGDPNRLAQIIREGEFDSAFDYPLYYALTDVFCKDAPLGRLAAMLTADRFYEHPERLVTFVDNHDLPRVASACGGNLVKVAMALRVMSALRGTPSFTYGTECGLLGEKEPENRGDMHFGSLPLFADIADALRARTHFDAEGPSQILALTGDILIVGYRAAGARAFAVGLNRSPSAALFRAEFVEDLRLPAQKVSVLPLPPKVLEQGRARDVKFEVADVRLDAGDRLYLAGSGLELGNWAPARALGPFVQHAKHLSAQARFPSFAVFAYKLLIRKRSGQWVWQALENRYLHVLPGQTPLSVELSWNA